MHLRNIDKSYTSADGSVKEVLKGFCADIPDGGITLVTGESGCGKTTLLRIIAGLEPYNGEIIRPDAQTFSVVFQEDRLCPELSAVENCIIAGTDMASAAEALESMGLGRDDIIRPVGELSGGMRRRTAAARALLAESNVILMDEPFSGLDAALRRTTAETIKRLRAGRTTIIVTHDASNLGFDCCNMICMGG